MKINPKNVKKMFKKASNKNLYKSQKTKKVNANMLKSMFIKPFRNSKKPQSNMAIANTLAS